MNTPNVKPNMQQIGRLAPENAVAVIVTVSNNEDLENCLIMISREWLKEFSITDNVSVDGQNLSPAWGQEIGRVLPFGGGYKFDACGSGSPVLGFRLKAIDRDDLAQAKLDIAQAQDWERDGRHKVEYVLEKEEVLRCL